MRRAKLASLVLCLLLLGAGVARANEWSIAGKGMEELKIKSETASGKGGLFKIPVKALALTIECATVESSGLVLVSGAGVEGTLTLSSCKAEAVKGCTFKPIAIKAFAEVAERNGGNYLVFESKSGPLATVVVSGAECVLPKESSLTGDLAAELKLGESIERTFEFTGASATAAETSLKFGTQAAGFEGKLTISLSGTQKGKVWGAAKGGVGLGPGTELNFTAEPVGTVKTITVENAGLSLSP